MRWAATATATPSFFCCLCKKKKSKNLEHFFSTKKVRLWLPNFPLPILMKS
jgi:hypothetical protein